MKNTPTPKAKARQILDGLKTLTPEKLDTMVGRDPAMVSLLKRIMTND